MPASPPASAPASFDLLTQPWLPCLPLESDMPVMRSLPDALAEAHLYRELVADSPLVSVALHRLLLAVLHRAYMGPRTTTEWHTLRNAGRFDAERVRRYLADPRWRTHFDLFDARRPFYQTPAMADADPISVAKLSIERASGNNITLFDHTTGATASFTPAEAARNLVAFQQYALGGGVSHPFHLVDAPLARDYTTIVRGKTLFETLLLNLRRYDDEAPPFQLPLADDSAWWERERDPEPDRAGTMPRGYCDYLTWQSRRVHLVYDETTGVIRQCQVGQNLKLSPLAESLDPFKAYRQDAQRGLISRILSKEKAAWRDSHALLEEARPDGSGGSRPEIFQWLATLFPTTFRNPSPSFAFEVIGYLTDGPQGAVILWRRDRLPLPMRFLAADEHGKALRDELASGLKVAEEVSQLFRAVSIPVKSKAGKAYKSPSPMRILAEGLLTMSPDRKPDLKDITNLIDHFAAGRTYWAALEPPFRTFMLALAHDPASGQTPDDYDDYYHAVLSRWKEDIRAIARRTFDDLVAALESDAQSLRAAALAQRQFNWLLTVMLPPAERHPAPVGSQQEMEAHA